MPYETSVILDASTARSRAVLVSERTQVLALSALDIFQRRENFTEMSDEDWDLLFGNIGDAVNELLEIQAGSQAVNNLALRVKRTTEQSIPADGAFIEWTDTYSPDNYTYNDSGFVLSDSNRQVATPSGAAGLWLVRAAIQFNPSGTARLAMRIETTKSDILAYARAHNSGNNITLSCSAIVSLTNSQYVKIFVDCANAQDLLSTNELPVLELLRLGDAL